MKKMLFLMGCCILAGCAENEERARHFDEAIIFPNGATVGETSDQPAIALADIMIDANSKAMDKSNPSQIEKIQTEQKETAEQALSLLEKISNRQGSGEISLFFKRGSAELEQDSLEYLRLVQFLDYLVRESHGRQVLLVCIGSASGIKDDPFNIELSINRAKAPIETIKKYLVNTPHKIYEAYGIGDSNKNADIALTPQEEEKYQYVRIITAFEETELPLLPR